MDNQFDLVIVGGGGAGAVLAARLSENPSRKVLLLEAGRDWRASQAPDALRSMNFPDIVTAGDGWLWPDLTGRLTAAKDAEHYLVGRGLGGGSAVNGIIWARPMPADIDRWGAQGAAGWSFAAALPYLNRCEADASYGKAAYHGADGPMPVWRPNDDGEVGGVSAAFAAAVAGDVAFHPDLNAPDSTGLSSMPFHARAGQGRPARVTTNDAYLEPNRERANLTIRGETLVDRVVFDGDRACGVQTADGETIRADRVILAAGAIYSPAILMRSGIGAPDLLRSLDVDVRADAPGVGANLTDHVMLSTTFALTESAQQTDPNGPMHGYYLRWRAEHAAASDNDLTLFPQNLIGVGNDALATGGLVLSLLDPYSRGSVRLASRDPKVDPIVDVNALNDARDLERMREGAKHLFALTQASRIREIQAGGARFAPRGGTGRPVSDFTGADIENATLQGYAAQFFHPVGTCRMGATDDPMSVTDSSGRVYGLDGLTVCDASLMPTIPRANTLAATVMLAEAVAESWSANTRTVP